jgi:predicted site-specific integrase-resolvase
MENYQKQHTTTKEWMSIKEACNYIGVSYNTFMKYREKGLKVCEIEGIKRVSKDEIDIFLNQFSY